MSVDCGQAHERSASHDHRRTLFATEVRFVIGVLQAVAQDPFDPDRIDARSGASKAIVGLDDFGANDPFGV